MTGCDVDPDARVARIGAGATWQQVLDAATPHGLAPLCGSSPGVGVVGFLTGGGIGPLVRTVGVSSDYVRAFELVTGDGDILRVTPEQHGDLFWGLRGSKSTLGIVTAVEIDLPPDPRILRWGNLFRRRRRRVGAARMAAVERRAARVRRRRRSRCCSCRELPDVPPPLAGRFTVAVRYVAVGDAGEALDLLDADARGRPGTAGRGRRAAVRRDRRRARRPAASDAGLRGPRAAERELTTEAVDAMLAVAGPDAGSLQAIIELRLLGGAFARPRRGTAARSAIATRRTR